MGRFLGYALKQWGLPVVLALTASAASAASLIHTGEPVHVGNGTARTVVVTDANGIPQSVSVVFSGSALSGLPAARSDQSEWEYLLPMPAGAPPTGYDHVGLDWNPAGHAPQGVYTHPHFDVHFYMINRAQQEAVTFIGEAAARGLAPPDARTVPADYVVPPDTAVERMGLHGVDTQSHEFRGKPFTSTFLYGYYEGRMVFLEPMVTLAFLQSRPDVTMPVKRPLAYSLPGYYPAKYRIGYDPELNQYQVSLLDLRAYATATAER
ncbi:DUF5602 domain-containing protein [Arhodomonas aquaeolei]|uniref:DUF5602 domain-containing protein n=1 Tax=Arhodomonas aquaeolei TaxID=2369 RepID=UPI00216A5DB5|nr:DUF5602 domain-containing protein [Arhodomonas aquaeolei]MCS4505611.1 DUF5602 domain-containing protein [Arhodomonas aquaeolei]